MRAILFCLALGIAVFQSATVVAEQKGYSGMPLEKYCNIAPDLSVQRTDSVENWVTICTVWLKHQCAASSMPKKLPEPATDEKKKQ